MPLETLNHTLRHYPLLREEKPDRPSEVQACHLEGNEPDKGHKIKQTSGQMLVIARNFIPMFTAFIMARGLGDHPQWRCTVQLLMIFWSCMSVDYSVDDLLTLEGMIGDFYDTFLEAFGEQWTLPKHHFLLHLPLQMYLFGPMRYIWCMRFEAKHQWFKRLVQRTSHRNIMWTMATQHQHWLALKFNMDISDATTMRVKDELSSFKITTSGSPMHKSLLAVLLAAICAPQGITMLHIQYCTTKLLLTKASSITY